MIFLIFGQFLPAQSPNTTPASPAELRLSKGYSAMAGFKYEEALKSFQAAGKLFEDSGDLKGMMRAAAGRGDAYFALNRPKDGIPDLTSILEKGRARYPDAVETGSLVLRLGIQYFDGYKDNAALRYLQEAETLLLPQLPNDHQEMAVLHHYYGEIYNSMGDRQAAIEHLRRAVDLYQMQATDNRRFIARIYMLLSQSYLYSHQSDQALLYGKQSVVIFEEVFGQIHPEVATAYRALGHVYTVLEDNGPALKYHEKSLEIVSRYYGDDNLLVARGYNSMGNVYINLRDSLRALSYYQKAEEIALKRGNKDNEMLGIIYHNLGIMYFNFRDYPKAREYWEKAIPLYARAYSNKHFAITEKMTWIGETWLHEGEFENALEWQRKAMLRIDPSWSGSEYTLPNLNAPRDRDVLFTVVSDRAATMLARYQYGGSGVRDLEFAGETFAKALDMLDSLRKGLVGDNSRLNWNDVAFRFSEGAIHSAFELYQVKQDALWRDRAFSYMERSKSSVLMSALNSMRAAHYASVPDSLMSQETELGRRIGEIEMEIFEIQHDEEEIDQARLRELKAESFHLNLARIAVVRDIETNYPDYYKLKYDLAVVQPEDVRNYLPDDQTAMIEYFMGDSAVYIFAITTDGYLLKRLPSDGLDELIGQFMENFEPEAVYRKSSRDNYPVQAFALYQRLLAPVQDFLPDGGNLIIVPDGKLGHLPFEALLTRAPQGAEEGNFAAFPYLLHQYSLSYANSATLLLNRRSRRMSLRKLRMMAFAPDFADKGSPDLAFQDLRAGLSKLEYAPREVEKISRFVDTDAFTGAEATEHLFKESGNEYNILHFATHGMVEDKNSLYSRIAFSPPQDSLEDGMLHTYELFSMKLSADLAVLSACNTGMGELVRGEGIMSLARGFMYAGCPSIVMSLWSVNDEASAAIMEEFYRHLAEGMTKDESLRSAKIDYLQKAEGRQAHPYYWAAHVLIGDRSSLGSKGPGPGWLVLVVALGSGALVAGWRKTKKAGRTA
jgi:CHAT domain-containing protein/Tfp pilus assembly protein PilF